MSPPTLRDRAEYAAFRLARGALKALPEAWALRLGSLLGWTAGSLLRIRRGVVDDNLARAFPGRDRRWRRRVAVASYRHLGREAVATFLFSGASRDAVKARTEVVGLDVLDAARREQGGAVLVTGHLGNWEVGGSALAAQGVPVDAVALRQRNRLFDRDLVENRRRMGIRVIPRGRASRDVLKSLAEGRVPALVADQDARARGLFVDFLGVPASTARGPAVLSLRAGVPLILGVGLVLPGRPHRYRVHLERVPFEPRGDVAEDVRRLLEAQVAVLERWVRAHPEQYFWQHRRWKTRPDDPISPEPGPSEAGRRRGGPGHPREGASRNRAPSHGL